MADGYFEKGAKKRGVKIISIRRAGWLWRNFCGSASEWVVVINYKNKLIKMRAWAGIYNPTIDNIYFSILEEIDIKDVASKFHKDISKFAKQGLSETEVKE